MEEAGTLDETADALRVQTATGISRERIWRALTDERDRWWPGMRFEPVEGSPLQESWDEGGLECVAEGHVTEAVPERALAFEWIEAGWEQSLEVRITLGQEEGRTVITVSESGFAALENGATLRRDHLDGWAFHLEQLVAAAEREG